MSDLAIAGAGTSVTADRLVRLFVPHLDKESFAAKPLNATYEAAPTELAGSLCSIRDGARATLVCEAYVIWAFRTFHPLSNQFVWVVSTLRTDKNGYLLYVADFDEAIPEVTKRAPPQLTREPEGYLFWTYSRPIADRVKGDLGALSRDELLKNGFSPVGGGKYSSAASGASLGSDEQTSILVDMVAAQVPGLPYMQGFDLFAGDTLIAAYNGCPKNKVVFDPHGTYLLAKRPSIATVTLLELAGSELRRLLGNGAWFLGTLAEYAEVALATVDGKPIAGMQDQLLAACKGFKSSSEDVADGLRRFAQQCAENVFQLAKKEARKAEKALITEAKKKGEEVLGEAREDAKKAARTIVLREWRKHVGKALGPEMLLAMVRLRQNGIAYQNILSEMLEATDSLFDPMEILKNLGDIAKCTMAYFDAYTLGMELRECFASSRDIGVPEWFQTHLQQKALMEAETARLRADVRAIYNAARGNKVDHCVDVAMHVDTKGGDDPMDLVLRFDMAATQWGIDWWSGAFVSAVGLADEKVKETLGAVSNLGKSIADAMTAAFRDLAHELLGSRSAQWKGRTDLSGWLSSINDNLTDFGVTLGVTGTKTVEVCAVGEVTISQDGFLLKVTSEGKTLSLPLRVAAFGKVDDAVGNLLGAVTSKVPFAKNLLTKKTEKQIFALIEKALANQTLLEAEFTGTLEVPTFGAEFMRTGGVIQGLLQCIERLKKALSTVDELAEKEVIPWLRTGEKCAVAVEGVASVVSVVLMGKTKLGLDIKTAADKVAETANQAQVILGDVDDGLALALGSIHELDKMFTEAGEVLGNVETLKGTTVCGTSGSAAHSFSLKIDGMSPTLLTGGVGYRALDTKVPSVGDVLDLDADIKRLVMSVQKEIGIVGAVASTLSSAAAPSGKSSLAELVELRTAIAELSDRSWLMRGRA